MFSFKLLSGDSSTVIEKNNSIVFTRSCAEKFFGDEDPVGKKVTLISGQDRKDYLDVGKISFPI